jgi:hypothetical protein
MSREDVGLAGEELLPGEYSLCLTPAGEAVVAVYIQQLERYAKKAYILCGPTPTPKDTQ